MTGIDKIPAKVLKISADIIAPSLTKFIIFVRDWKLARVQPMYKSDDRSKCENYRPISILLIVCKIVE